MRSRGFGGGGLYLPTGSVGPTADQRLERAAAGFVALLHEADGFGHLAVVVHARDVRVGVAQCRGGGVSVHQQRDERRGGVAELVRRPVLDQVALRTARLAHRLVGAEDGLGDVLPVRVLCVHVPGVWVAG